eukprot:jgi/Ulvmu1/10334/UM061_0017.1
MITGNNASPNQDTRPNNFNEWGNPLFRPNNGDTRGSDPGYSMAYRPTSVPFRHIEDIASRLGKVNATKRGHSSQPMGSPLLRTPLEHPAVQPADSSLPASPDSLHRPPHHRADPPSAATELASASPAHPPGQIPDMASPLRHPRRAGRHTDRPSVPVIRARSAFESSPLPPESVGPIDPPPRQRLSIRQSIQALAVGTANSLRRSTRHQHQPSTSLNFEDAVHATCFNCTASSSKKPVIPIPVVPRRRPRKRLWRRCHTWRALEGLEEPVRSSSMGALASPSSMCLDDMSSLTNCVSRSFLQARSPGHPFTPDGNSRTRDLLPETPGHDDAKGSCTPVSDHSAQLVASSPRRAPLPPSPDPPPHRSPDHGLLPPPPNIPLSSRTHGAYALDSYSSQSRDCQLLQVASGPPHSAATEAAASGRDTSTPTPPAPDSAHELSPRDSMSERLEPAGSDSIELGPTATLQMYGSELSGELLGGGSSRRAGGSAPVVPHGYLRGSPARSSPLAASPPAPRKFSMARRPSPAAMRRARLAADFHGPPRGAPHERHPSAPLSPPQQRAEASPSAELPRPRRALSQDTWTRVHASGVWHGQTLAELNNLKSEWQTIKRSLNNTRTSPHTSASPASRRSTISEQRAQIHDAGAGEGMPAGAASTVGRHSRSHSLGVGAPSRPPHLPAAPVRGSDGPPLRRGSQRRARSRSGSAKAIDPKTTPFSPSPPLQPPVEESASQAQRQPLTNSARLHAQRLAAIRAGLRSSLPDAQQLNAAEAVPLSPGAAPAPAAQRDLAVPADHSAPDGDIRSANTAARRIGRDPRPRMERTPHAATAPDAAALAAELAAKPAGGVSDQPPQPRSEQPASSPPISPSKMQQASVPPWQQAARKALESRESSSLSLAGPSGSLTRMGGGASTIGLLESQRLSTQRSCSPKVSRGPPQVRRTGPYSHGTGRRGASRGKHSGPRSVPARVSAVWR